MYSEILVLMLPVITDELAIFLDNKKIVSKDQFYKPEVKVGIYRLRQHSLKNSVVYSKKSSAVKKNMGLNFEDLVYDMNIISDKKEVFSTNFNQYYDDIEENYIFYNSMSIFLEDSVKEILEHALFEPSILYENEKYISYRSFSD